MSSSSVVLQVVRCFPEHFVARNTFVKRLSSPRDVKPRAQCDVLLTPVEEASGGQTYPHPYTEAPLVAVVCDVIPQATNQPTDSELFRARRNLF